jgi:hypothetical protein
VQGRDERRRPSTSVAGLSINRDLIRYRERYPGEAINIAGKNLNLRFYRNEIQCVPDGDYIDQVHERWFGQ